MLRDYVARIPLDSPDNWPVHLAGHPPGAVLMFIGLDRVGLGSWQAAGLVVVVVAATVPAAVAVTLDRLGARARGAAGAPLPRHRARRHPHGGLGGRGLRRDRRLGGGGPRRRDRGTRRLGQVRARAECGPALRLVRHAVVRRWSCSAPWPSRCLLVRGRLWARASVRWPWCAVSHRRRASSLPSPRWASPGGRRTPFCRNATGPAWPASGPAGTGWWATSRPWCSSRVRCCRPRWVRVCAAGRAAPPAAARAGGGPRRRPALAMVAVADLSLMSKAEVERIWLPFLPWLMLSVVWLPDRWRRWGLVAQASSRWCCSTSSARCGERARGPSVRDAAPRWRSGPGPARVAPAR